MTGASYRLKNPITVVVCNGKRYRLIQLPAQSVFHVSCAASDPNGMIEGTCKGDTMLMFSRDLEDRTEPLAAATHLELVER